MIIIMAIFEFSLVLFMWTRGVEATRAGVRYAIVNTPIVDITDTGILDCSSGTNTKVEPDCSSGSSCDGIVAAMQQLLPSVQHANVQVVYECSKVGNPDRPIQLPIPEVRVSIQNLSYDFIVPDLLGLGASITMPEFTSTMTGEDLNTVIVTP